MNQPRRTFLQAILGLFGLGVTKAVAKPIDQWTPPKPDPSLYGTKFWLKDDPAKPQFDAAIGVVARGGTTWIAGMPLVEGVGRHERRWDYVGVNALEITASRIELFAEHGNWMIFAEANGPDGAALVAELMKRCPERVYRRKSYILDRESHAGYDASLIDNAWSKYLTKKHDWATDNKDQAMARSLAILGKQILSAPVKEENVLVVGGCDTICQCNKDGLISQVR